MAWHGRKRAHLFLKVSYKIGEQPELQACFYMYCIIGIKQGRGARCFVGLSFVSVSGVVLLS